MKSSYSASLTLPLKGIRTGQSLAKKARSVFADSNRKFSYNKAVKQVLKMMSLQQTALEYML